MLIFRTYNVPIDDIRKKIKEIDGSNEDPNYLPYISDELRNLVETSKPVEPIKNELGQFKNALKAIENNQNKLLKAAIENNQNNFEVIKGEIGEIKDSLNDHKELLYQIKSLMDETKMSQPAQSNVLPD